MQNSVPNAQADALANHLTPPCGMWPKFRYYKARYGLVHALCSFAGRKCLWLWALFGPIVTRSYLLRWLKSPGPHVLNLGGGGVLASQWLTADVTPRADVFMDITKPLPLSSNILDGVYSEEVIEHIDLQAGTRMLSECLRVLKPGGTIRLTTPSLDFFARQALSDSSAIQSINDIFYRHGHRFIYSESFLRETLAKAGFANIQESSYRDEKSKFGKFDSHPARFAFAPPEWSQYWEAEKPGSASLHPTEERAAGG